MAETHRRQSRRSWLIDLSRPNSENKPVAHSPRLKGWLGRRKASRAEACSQAQTRCVGEVLRAFILQRLREHEIRMLELARQEAEEENRESGVSRSGHRGVRDGRKAIKSFFVFDG